MKSLQQSSLAAVASRGVRFLQRSAFSGVVLASLFASIHAYGQGAYYPVNNPGIANTGNFSYTGITINSNPNLQALQTSLQTLYTAGQLPPGGGAGIPTLQVPIPNGGYRTPTAAEYAAAVGSTVQGWLGTPGNFPNTVSLGTLVNEAIGWSPANRGTTADMIAKVVINYNSASAAANLNVVVNALATSQPTLIDTIMPYIFNDMIAAGQASTPPVGSPTYFGQNLATYWGANTTTAQGIPQVAAAAVLEIPADLNRVASITGAALSSINSAGATILTSAQKSALYIGAAGVVQTLLGVVPANNNPALIATIAQAVTSQTVVGIGGTTLAQILTAEKSGLTAGNTVNNSTMAALASGALLSQPSAGTVGGVIDTTLGTAYTSALIVGYNNATSSTTFTNAVLANPTSADAIAQGATVKNNASLTAATIVQLALVNGTASPSNIVAAVIIANQSQAANIVKGAINPSNHMPYGSATFGNIAYGGAQSSPLQQVGNVIQTIISNSASSTASLVSATVNQIVDQAIQGAQAGGNSGAYADIVYKSEYVARNTSGTSGPLTTQAVDSLAAVPGGGVSISYLGEIAALAGDSGANRTAITTAGNAALTATTGDTVAGAAGANLVQSLQTTPSKTFVSTISAFETAFNGASPTNSVLADLYAAVLANPTESDAALAAAIKQTNISDTTLTEAANDAYRATYGNFELAANLAMVDTVVTHIKSEALAGPVNDLFDFVGHQIVLNNSLVADIAVAATVVDPDNANFIATSVAFNASTVANPTGATGSIASIFKYAQITNPTPYILPSIGNPAGTPLGSKTFPGSTKGAIIDQPAAAAAITAGLVTGILEANLDPTLGANGANGPNTASALTSAVQAAVAASIAQNGTNLTGPAAGHVFNNPGDTALGFQQMVISGSGTAVTTQATVGAAGAITGYIAQVTQSGDITISAVTAAVLKAAVGGSARNYAMQIAQAAGQAFGWVSGSTDTTLASGHPAFDIATAMASTVAGFASITQLEAAVSYGISQAAAGVIGAGALGLNTTSGTGLNNGTPLIKATLNSNNQFYIHRSGAGTPVTDIFNL